MGRLPRSPWEAWYTVASTVVSVGPYRLRSALPEDQRATSDAGHASPATASIRVGETADGDRPARIAGGSTAASTRFRNCSRAAGVLRSCSEAMTRQAPDVNALQRSATELSTAKEAKTSTRRPGCRSWSIVLELARPGSPRWVTATPLGVPVEPEV